MASLCQKMVYCTRVGRGLPVLCARHSTCTIVAGVGVDGGVDGGDEHRVLFAHLESTITERNLRSFMDTLSRNRVKWDLFLLGGMRKRHGAEVPIDRDGILDFINGTLNGCLREGTKVDESALADFMHQQRELLQMDGGFHFTVLQLIIELAKRSGGPDCCVRAVTPVPPTFLDLDMGHHWIHFILPTVDAAGIPCLQVMEVPPQKDGADGIPKPAYQPTDPLGDAIDSRLSPQIIQGLRGREKSDQVLYSEHMEKPLGEVSAFPGKLGPGAHEVAMSRLEGLIGAMDEGAFKRTMEDRLALVRAYGGPRCVTWEELAESAIDCRTYTLHWSGPRPPPQRNAAQRNAAQRNAAQPS